MTNRKTTVVQRSDVIVRKKAEECIDNHTESCTRKCNSRNLIEREVLVCDQLKTLGIAGGYYPLISCDSTNNVLKKLSQNIISRETFSDRPDTPLPQMDDSGGWYEFWLQKITPNVLPYVITAEKQTVGRGRQSNTWWTGQGALALSMLVDAKQHGLKPQNSAQLSLGIGFAAMQALRIITEETMAGRKNDTGHATIAIPNIEIRWPNDVYINDRKITGILIEAPNIRHLVIGIGVNTNNSAVDAPKEIRDRIVTLSDVLGHEIDNDRFIYLLCREIMEILGYFPSRLSQLIKKIEANLYQVGKTVNIIRENEQIVGLCLGLNADGSLQVRTETGERAVVSGVAV